MTLRPTTRAVGGTREVAVPDPVARDYILLSLRLDQHVPGLVDGYFGPGDLKAQVDMEQRRAPNRLADDATELRGRVAADVVEPDRRDWLDAQLVALETHARTLAGDHLAYEEEVARCFGWRVTRRADEYFEEAAATIDRLLPGGGSVAQRMAAWDARFVIDPDRVAAVADWLVAMFRERAAPLFGIPDGESLRVSLVRDQPWSGYNWYDGGRRSRIDLNLDLPIRAPDLAHTIAHETYPGHHLEHVSKEQALVDGLGRLEASILLINTPDCLVSEGLANLGRRVIVDPADEVPLLVELFERSGLALAADPGAARAVAETTVALVEPRRRLGEITVNAALLRHADGRSHEAVADYMRSVGRMDPERVEKRLEFIEHPLWRTYIFVYTEGEALLERWLAAAPPTGRAARFGRLLREQLTPRALAAEIGDGRGET